MGKVRLAVYAPGPYSGGELFNQASRLNRDDCLAGFRRLKALAEASGGECLTFDQFGADRPAPDAVLFLDIPAEPVSAILGARFEKVFKCVLLQEPEIIIPRNWDARLHLQFDRLLTWNDSLVDNKRYFKFNYANVLPAAVPKDPAKKEKLCALIAGNCVSGHPAELYSRRVEAIRWFEANHPEDFDLYGRGWDEYRFSGPRLARALNRVKPLTRLLAPKFPSYRGEIASKQAALEKHKFAICYENSAGMPGYISEKIFDCFGAGCVPVYWGAPNVKDHIPAECFLDRRDFGSYEELYAALRGMSGGEYLSRLRAIEAFLGGEKGRRFSDAAFAESVLNAVI